MRSAITEPEGARPTFLEAVRSAIADVTTTLEEHGVTVAQPVRNADLPPPTAEELQWLSEWIDEQPTPEAVTVEQADAAIAARRSATSVSQRGSSSAVFTRLQEAQVRVSGNV
mmetsp:Transcript_17538/g.52449  ORF Transcript_17538/g.52449 Transcript_17538/m.52449 type:complete len:113 (-) Transcript_17538:22-360(-)